MKRFTIPLLLAFAVSAFAQNDAKVLSIGDPAPEFKVDGFIKGEKVDKLQKGKAYVIEFWATWCGPCIAVFPHLSELTEKYKDQITTVSVNTWDYRGDADKPAHIEKINNFLVKHGDNMRYNIVLDDDKDTIAKTWMTAAGRNGIPCAFIVNEDGLIAWIGHPASMDKPLEAIVNKTWDIQAEKKKYDDAMRAQLEAAAKAKQQADKITELAKTNDLEGFDKLAKEMGAREAVIAAINGDPNFGTLVLERYAGKVEGFTHDTFCSIAAFLSGKAATTADSKAKLVKVSEACFGMLAEDKAAMAAVYHAQVLLAKGDKKAAGSWLTKAEGLVGKLMPENGRARVTALIATVRKQVDAAN